MAVFEFKDNTTSVDVDVDTSGNTFSKNEVFLSSTGNKLYIKDKSNSIVLYLIDLDKDTVTGTGSTATTGKELRDLIKDFFYS